MTIKKAIKELQKGNFVLIHDDSEREDETDMVIPASKTTPEHVATMRNDAGGLICVAIHPKSAKNLKVPLMSQIYEKSKNDFQILKEAKADDIPYGERSSFSIAVNHRDTFTGITDKDRALTIKKLGEIAEEAQDQELVKKFGKEFRTPGHVPLLKSAKNPLKDRDGHTEYSIALTEMAETGPAAVVCEMMDSETHEATTGEKAKKYAEENDLIHLKGDEIKKKYFKWKKQTKEG